MFGQDYTHDYVTDDQARSLEEIEAIDALRVGLMVAQIRAYQKGRRYGYLDRLDAFLENRKRGLLRAVQGAGVMYMNNGEAVRPVYVAALELEDVDDGFIDFSV